MPHRTRAWIWAGRAAAAAAVIGLAGYLFAVGLDQAGRLAAPVGLVIALAALFVPYLLPVYQPPVPPPSDPAPPGPDSGAQPRPPTPAKLIVATGGSVAAERVDHLRYYQAPPRPVTWPVLVGQIPTLASAFQDRPGLRDQVKAARKRGSGVVLTQVLAGGSGVGKSQLAASYADQAVRAGTDLVVWVTAARAEAVVAAYAQAAARVQASGADGADAETDARAFMDWLAATQHSWLVVLDDITDPGYVERWWPNSHPGTGWVLATTRRHDAKLSGSGRAVLDIGVYTPDESAAYLRDRLTGAGMPSPLSQDAERLAAELGYLPLALSHAAAYMINQQLSCDKYLALFTGRSSRLTEVMPADADAESYGRQIDVTLLLAVDAAQAADPAGLALPALRLAAVLDPAGHPDILWASPAVTRYLATHRTRVASLQPEPRARPGITRRFLKYRHPCDLRVRSTATKINMRVNARRAPSVEAGQDFD
ncbi:MAG TPA: NB-ARC domain-containing protein, partial [Streptosporangiaceae bacterium]|nr:NB-ARC domain-containing protein [Streptosporangiaceae bacterium]